MKPPYAADEGCALRRERELTHLLLAYAKAVG